MPIFFFNVNWAALNVPPFRPWWQQVFYHGTYDRDDKLVDWVYREYAPGDGVSRHALRGTRNTWLIPEVVKAGNRLVVAESVMEAIQHTGSDCEFFEVQFDHLYEVPWGANGPAPLPPNASDAAVARITHLAKHRSTRRIDRQFELISATSTRCRGVAGKPRISVNGKLRASRTVDLIDTIAEELDLELFQRFRAIYHSGGMLCDESVGRILREASDPNWFVLEPLSAVVHSH